MSGESGSFSIDLLYTNEYYIYDVGRLFVGEMVALGVLFLFFY